MEESFNHVILPKIQLIYEHTANESIPLLDNLQEKK